MALPFPNSPELNENIADSISKIEQNLEFLNTYGTIQTKVVVVTQDLTTTSATVSTTGVGFLPTAMIVLAQEATGESMSWGLQSTTITDDAAIFSAYNGYNSVKNNRIIYLQQSATAIAQALLVSFDSDGFTLDYSNKAGAPAGNGTIVFFCMR